MVTSADAAIAGQWTNFNFGDWVPQDVREKTIDLWLNKRGLSPNDWQMAAGASGAPPHGALVNCLSLSVAGAPPKRVSGRFIYASGTIGKVVGLDGGVTLVHCGDWLGADEPAPPTQPVAPGSQLLYQELEAIAARHGGRAVVVAAVSLYGALLQQQR